MTLKLKNELTRNGDWSSYTIKESKKGWIVEGESRVQGCKTDYKYFLPFENSTYKKGTNLNENHNELFKVGEYIAEAEILDCFSNKKVLRKGHIVF